ncbi:MAG TPA: nitroreductase family protein [Acidimicrobiales bacterium]|nr:nitroreductase family protein [Acidimicrobiales bacterium]
MELRDVIAKRRMVRSFADEPLEREVVERILAHGQRAPSAGFSQGWAFLVLDGPDEVAQFWDLTFPADRRDAFAYPGLFRAPLIVVPLSHRQAYLDRYAEPDKGWTDKSEAHWPVPYWHIDTGMAALLMLLTAVDEGLGALFFGIMPDHLAPFRSAFGVPDEYTPIGAIAIGHPDGADAPSPSLRRGKRPAEEVVHRGRW